jgi:two-component system chemotaxis response regulator CheY
LAKVLVVDDAAFMRMRLVKLLKDRGYEVVEAGNGKEAVDRYGAERPAVVLMDITMPEMDGIAALKAIRAQDPDAHVIMCSALGQQNMVVEALEAGARDFVVKPYEPDRILQAVAKWAGG